MKLYAGIHHPQIIKLWDMFYEGNLLYMVMEYAEKGNLLQHRLSSTILSEGEAFKYVSQAVKGLGYLHSHNIIYGGLKVFMYFLSLKTSFSIPTTMPNSPTVSILRINL